MGEEKKNEEETPVYGPFFGVMGASSAMVFSAQGPAYGTAKSGTGPAPADEKAPAAETKDDVK